MSAFPDPHIWLAHRVAHEETDANGELYHAKYLHLFEKGSSEFMRAHSIGYAEMESRALFLPVREAAYRCHASARYDEPFWIRAGIGKWGRASLRFFYELWDESRKLLLATGFTQHVTVDPAGKIVLVPSWLRRIGAK